MLVVKVAVPFESCAVPNSVGPLLNVTVPVGAVAPEAAETLAVKVTLDPALACADDTVSAVVVVTRKVPVTDCAAVIEIEQAPPPEQAPLHPAKVDPAAGAAVNVTTVPLAKFALQVPGQLMPAGTLEIEPEPAPASATDSAKGTTLKVAVTDCAEVMVTLQLPVPEQAPLHPAKVDPAAEVAVNVTTVPPAKLALQVLGQLMPAGVLVTEPVPAPASVTDSAKVTTLKVAVTDCAEFMVTLQLPVPEQAPLHPAKEDPAAGVAVRVTTVPLAKFALQVPGQLMPVGVLETVPPPFPASTAVRGKVTQFGNLKLAIRVFQLNEPLVLMYSFVYQNVQSSTGSTCMAL